MFGTVEQIFDDVWWAWGTVRFGPGIRFPRNMVIIRERGELVIIHAVMMPEPEQAKIEALGPIKHVIRLGTFHGMDDLLYVKRYGATTWAPPDVETAAELKIDRELVPGGELPLANATLFDFTQSRSPETILHLARHGGILFACDSIQNWDHALGLSALGGIMTKLMGFRGRACIGPGWRRVSESKQDGGFAPDFARLMQLEFRHIVGAHGSPMKDTGRDDLRARLDQLYPAST